MLTDTPLRIAAQAAMVTLFAALLSVLIVAQDTRQLTSDRQNSEKRTALVIGNGNYQHARTLANPSNDANDLAAALTELGFDVVIGIDLSLTQMQTKVREFGDKLKTNGGVGLVYYAGHGVQVNGGNYLVPVDADILREDEIIDGTLSLEQIFRKLDTAGNGFNIVILDACRNNPFTRSWGRGDEAGGLAQVAAPTGTFIAYSTSPDHTANDGNGRNGLYTAQLLRFIRAANLKIEETFKEVRKAVDSASFGKQIPWDSSSLRGEFYFKRAQPTDIGTTGSIEFRKPTPLATPAFVSTTQAMSAEEIYWQEVSDRNTQSGFELYLAEYPKGKYAIEANHRIDNIKDTERARQKSIEESRWREAHNLNTIAAYRSYLGDYPKGEFATEARNGVRGLERKEEQTKWGEAQNSDSVEGYTSYLSAYPAGEFATLASSAIKTLDERADQAKWDEVQVLNRKSAFQSYLAAYPKGKYTAIAQQKIQEFDEADASRLRAKAKEVEVRKWQAADSLKTISGYEEYLLSYPYGEYASLARLRLNGLGKKVEHPKKEGANIAPGNGPIPDNEIAVIEMENPFYGTIRLELYSNIAPKMVARFKELVREGFYNGTTYHRVNGTLIQGGDPKGDGTGGSLKPDVPAEFSDVSYDVGIVGAARRMDINSANSQFFVMLKREEIYDRKYTVFGKVIEGMNNLRKIVSMELRTGERPNRPIKIKRITIVSRTPITVSPTTITSRSY